MKQNIKIHNSFLRILWAFCLGFTVLLSAQLSAQADNITLKAAVLKIGTVNWELDTIQHFGLDDANDFQLEIKGLAGNPATRVAFQAGDADIVVADWIWVARQRAAGKDYRFIPYSKSVGALMVKKDSGIASLADLNGKKIGIAGGPVDKSWLILQAYAKQELDFDLAKNTEQVFGAPPLIFKAALKGEVEGAINFWHFAAKMSTKGLTPLITVEEAAKSLGLNPNLPLLGYVVKGEMVDKNPKLIQGFMKASRDAKTKLASNDSAWERLRPIMRAKKDADFAALKAGFIAGIPEAGAVDENAASQMLEVMAKLGGEKLVGKATSLPEGVFVQGEK